MHNFLIQCTKGLPCLLRKVYKFNSFFLPRGHDPSTQARRARSLTDVGWPYLSVSLSLSAGAGSKTKKCDHKNGADIFEHRTRDGKPEKSGDGCEPESISRALRWCWSQGAANKFTRPTMSSSWKECRGQFSCERPKGTRRTRGQREKHTCHSDTNWEGGYCVRSHRRRCGKHCRRRFHGDDNISVGSSSREKCLGKGTEETLRGLWRNDYVSERECVDLCEVREKVPTQMSDHGTTKTTLSHSFKPYSSEPNTYQGCVGRNRTRWTLCERERLWADSKWTMEKFRLQM